MSGFTRSAISLVLGVVVGAAIVVGWPHFRVASKRPQSVEASAEETRKYESAQKFFRWYDEPTFSDHPFDPRELDALQLVTPQGRPGPSIRASEGRVVFLHFWATWCKPCLDEFPSIAALRTATGNDVDYYLLGYEPPDAILGVAARFDLPFYSYLDEEKLPTYLRRGELPRTYILRNGRIVYERVGPAPWSGEGGLKLLRQIVRGNG